jgi:hypothetical protein
MSLFDTLFHMRRYTTVRRRILLGLPLILVMSVTAPAFAHHTFSIEYDAKKCQDFKGTLTKLDWENPHVYFHVDLADANNQVTSWSFESVSVAYLKRGGVVRQDFLDNIGKMVTVRACLGKIPNLKRAAAESVTMPDGRVLKVGSDYEHGQN